MPERATPAYIISLVRHFEDLRDGTHGGSASREDKEAHFERAVQLLAPIARQVLTEMNTSLLLLDTGRPAPRIPHAETRSRERCQLNAVRSEFLAVPSAYLDGGNGVLVGPPGLEPGTKAL
jgi:hypothetical protein